MPAIHCGPAALDCRLVEAAAKVQDSVGKAWSGGLPYQTTVDPGVILRLSNRQGVQPCVDEFLKSFEKDIQHVPGHKTTAPVEDLGVLLLYGSAMGRPYIQTQTTVEGIAQAIFNWVEVAEEVSNAIRKGLQDGKAIFLSVYSPFNGIPDDMYDEGSLIATQHGVTVYHPGGPYNV